MKIAWFSPLPPVHSDIANFTQRLTGDLRARFETRFFTEQPTGIIDATADTAYSAPLASPPTALLTALNQCDVPVYNLGNNPAFFAHTWFLSQVKPGIVVLHDLKLHHFFEGIYRERLDDQATYLSQMRRYYGSLGYEAGMAYWRQELSIDFMGQHFPMTEWAIQGALAVVVHTAHALEIVQKLTAAPGVLIPLPYQPRTVVDVADDHPRTDIPANSPRSPVRLIIFGYLNVNRRVVEFLTALARMPERTAFDLQIIGEMQHRREVEAAVATLGLSKQVTMQGYVAEAELEEALDQASLAVNLRYPSMGEASGSQLRLWDHALPSLVTLTEGYAGLPADTVFFVRPEHEEADIQRHLRDFLSHPEAFREAGRLGQQWLRKHHRPAAYVEHLAELCLSADGLRLRHNQLRMADRVGGAIAPWLDAAPTTAREEHYAATIAQTF